ncbi:ADP-ribosylglycohydrolase family protein [Verrucomicrobiaceae bacterium 227]
MITAPPKDKFRGALLGLACGDALGTTVEFKPRGTFEPLTDIVGGGPFGLEPGQWTDDTSMALCLVESLLAHKGMNLEDQLERYLGWWKHGDNSVTGECFDIGTATSISLSVFESNGETHAGSHDPSTAGNGSIMRLAPVPLFFAGSEEDTLLKNCELSSVTTHRALECLHACRLFGLLIRNALSAKTKEEIFVTSDHFSNAPTSIKQIADRTYREKSHLDIRGSGYVVESLEAALWAFESTSTFEEGALKAVNLGDDADTTGAVFGQIAGAFYGEKGIPNHWLNKLAWRDHITRIADKLFKSAHTKDRS